MRDDAHGTVPSSAARWWLLLGYLAILVYALLAPFSFRWDAGFLAERAGRMLSPDTLTPGDAVDAVRNVLLLAGWGLLLVVTDRGHPRRRRIFLALGSGAAIGLTAEMLQLALPARTPTLLDAATNTAGAGLGALVADSARRAFRRGRDRPTALGAPAMALAVPYVLAVLAEAAFPLLRNAGSGGGSGGPLSRASWALQHFSWESVAVLPGLDFLLFLPAGFLLAAALWEVEATRGKAFEWAAAVGIGVAVLGEAIHAPLGTPLQVGPVLVHAAAFVSGAWLGVRLFPRWLRRRRGDRRIRDFLLAYAVVLALWRLRPFFPELDPGAIAAEFAPSRWSPLAALGARRELYSVSDVLRSFLLFVPVGVALAARERTGYRGRERRGLRAMAAVTALALILEGGQALVAGRFFDGTDLLVMAAGGAVAWSLARERRA